MVETHPPAEGFQAARKAMIDSQLRTTGVTSDFVLKRMRAVPREQFVPESARGFAYMDRAIPLGDGRFLAPPLFQGKLLEEANPQSGEHVVLVDGGSGYMAELLRPLVGSLDVLTPEAALKPSRERKKADLLMIDGAVEHVPDALAKRLADDGRIVTGLVQGSITRVARGRKTKSGLALIPVMETGVPRLPEFDKPRGWSF